MTCLDRSPIRGSVLNLAIDFYDLIISSRTGDPSSYMKIEYLLKILAQWRTALLYMKTKFVDTSMTTSSSCVIRRG